MAWPRVHALNAAAAPLKAPAWVPAALGTRGFHGSSPDQRPASPGFKFNFRLRTSLSSSALRSDRPPSLFAEAFRSPVHDLRSLAFARMRGKGDDGASLVRDSWADDLAPWEGEGETLLGSNARGRLEPRWLAIRREARRDGLVRKVLQEEDIRRLWEAVGGRGPGSGQGNDTWDDCPRSPARHRQNIAALCNAFRASMRRASGRFEGAEDHGWGSCRHNWRTGPIKNPDATDFDEQRVDIPFFASWAQEDARPDWTQVVSTLSVLPDYTDDLSVHTARECFKHAGKLAQYHPLCVRSHHATVSGTMLRLWRVEPASYATTRAYSFARKEDKFAIGQILAFLTAAQPDCILPRWLPPRMLEVEVPATDGDESSGPLDFELWEWVGQAPKVVDASPYPFGSRTTVFAGRARLLHDLRSQLDPVRHTLVDFDGSKAPDGRLTFIKASFLPAHLLGHEHAVQRRIADVPGTPVPLGEIQVPIPASEPPSFQHEEKAKKEGEKEPLYAHALAYQHTLGSLIPDELPETGLSKLFEQLTAQLLALAEKGVHYRDLHRGNVLCRLSDGDGNGNGEKGQPQLVLVDHGAARIDGYPSGSGPPQGETDPDENLETLIEIGEEDVHAGNVIFRACGMSELSTALMCLEDAAWLEAEEAGSVSAKTTARYRRELFLHSRSYIDDLESSLYLLLWLGMRRSFSERSEQGRDLMERLAAQKRTSSKRRMWESFLWWEVALKQSCPRMSDAWREMMVELHEATRQGQARVRKEREADPKLVRRRPEELFRLSDGERTCFRECIAIYRRHRERLSAEPLEGRRRKEGGIPFATKGSPWEDWTRE